MKMPKGESSRNRHASKIYKALFSFSLKEMKTYARCPDCGAIVRVSFLHPDDEEALGKCPKCGKFFRTSNWWKEEEYSELLRRLLNR